MKLCDYCNERFQPTHGSQKRHRDCQIKMEGEQKRDAYRSAHGVIERGTDRKPADEPISDITHFGEHPDDMLLHPWALDGLGMPAGATLYITRRVYDELRDLRSLAWKSHRRADNNQ